MDLFLRKAIHPQARDNYRVILKDRDGLEVEVGSIGIQHGSGGSVFWAWAIDTVLPMRDIHRTRSWQWSRRLHKAIQSGLGEV